MSILNKISNLFTNSDEKVISKLQPIVDDINKLELQISKLSDQELADMTPQFKNRIEKGESLDDILTESFAVVREASKRTLNQRHYDVQLIGGIVLHQGKISEMRTGEGKTLVATLPAYLNALSGNSVHVVTVNDYLAKRDAQWMGSVYSKLGMTVSALQNNSSLILYSNDVSSELIETSRKNAYSADIIYGTNSEFGFDYLRDNMADSFENQTQGSRNFAIVDEVDNILIDEARTPLIISGPSQQNPNEYKKFSQFAHTLILDDDFSIDQKTKAISISLDGISKIEKYLKVKNLYSPENFHLVQFVENAIRAESVYEKDREYVVKNDQVIIVDEFTGRLMEGRRYSDGLHQAIEAKEKVSIQRETITYANITLQNYFRIYNKLSGMTGTALTEAEEFWKIYELEVVSIPTNKPVQRIDHHDLIFSDQKTKYNAVIQEIESRTSAGQPVLVGTTDIDKSELISSLLKKRGIKHEVLNAKQHEREASIVAQAGALGSVTVATNMAGRGTDIVLGGSHDEDKESLDEWQSKHEEVLQMGGLCIIGTERHEARRIDNQLRGRAGRQGDPGETRFYVALDDELVRRFGGDRIQGIMNWAGMDDETPIQNKMISKSIESAQVKVETHHFDMRKHLVDYDDVINMQRTVIYSERTKVLSGLDLSDQIKEIIRTECESICVRFSKSRNTRIEGEFSDFEENEDQLQSQLSSLFPSENSPLPSLPNDLKNPKHFESYDNFYDNLDLYIDSLYDDFRKLLGSDKANEAERYLMRASIDTNWIQHLTTMENLRQGIGLQSIGQRNPLVMYKKESHELFSALEDKIQSDVANAIFKIEYMNSISTTPHAHTKNTTQSTSITSKDNKVKNSHAVKMGRNEPCHCGSGKKFKKCHALIS
ncbi:MAG: preprotein translocase subunit SecA [Dehalococcoidia bacterium]